MSRTLGGPLTSHIGTRTHTRCTMLRLDLADGTAIGITDHDRVLAFDLGDGSIDYDPATGILPSDVVLANGFDADNFEVAGPISDTVTRAAILGGRFNRARCRLFQVNWNSLGSGAIKIMAGNVSEARIEGGRFILQIRSDFDRYNQTTGRVITPYCDADFGDARCGFDVVPVDATVTAVAGDLGFTVSFAGSYVNDYFNQGTVTFLTGDLAGTAPVEVFDWTSAGVVTMFIALAQAPTIGDTLELRQGCPKTRAACRDLFDNVLNFRGFPEVPGSDQVLKYAVPGSGGA